MRVKLLSPARVRTKKVQRDLLLAQADLHESTTDLAASIAGGVAPSRDSVTTAVEQNTEVQAQLNNVSTELETVSEQLRVAEARIEEVMEQAGPVTRSGEGIEALRALMGPADQPPDDHIGDEKPAQ